MTVLIEAKPDDVEVIVGLLSQMSEELNELDYTTDVARQSVIRSFSENVHYFLFSKNDRIIGTCYTQSVHNYWRLEKRFYLGVFYIQPEYRGQGVFREIYNQLKLWVEAHSGTQIYAHIHENNTKSLKAFESVGHTKADYILSINHWGD